MSDYDIDAGISRVLADVGTAANNGELHSNDFAGQLRASLLHGDEIMAIPKKEPLIEGWIDQGDFVVTYGRSGSGKTFVALDMAGCIATGSWWHGAAVTQGHVLYLMAEGAQGIPARWDAWKKRNAIYSNVTALHWLPRRVNLRTAHWAHAAAEVADEIRPRLVIVDTVARTFGAGNENASEDMGAYVAGIDTIRETTNAAVMCVHHTGKDEAAGGRGHSSLLGAVDVEIAVRNGGDGIITVEATKEKDRALGRPLRFTLASHGESVAVAPYDGRSTTTDLSQKTATVLAALERIATPTGVPMTAWREVSESDEVSRTTFYEARKLLLERGLVRSDGPAGRERFFPAQRGCEA